MFSTWKQTHISVARRFGGASASGVNSQSMQQSSLKEPIGDGDSLSCAFNSAIQSGFFTSSQCSEPQMLQSTRGLTVTAIQLFLNWETKGLMEITDSATMFQGYNSKGKQSVSLCAPVKSNI